MDGVVKDLFGFEPSPIEFGPAHDRRVAQPKRIPIYRVATKHECEVLRKVSQVSFGLCTGYRHFVESLVAQFKVMEMTGQEPAMTDAQARYLTCLAWRYRKQLPAAIAYPMTQDEIDAYDVDLRGKAA